MSGDDACPIINAWMDLPALVSRAGSECKIALIGKDGVNRDAVADNSEVLEPIIREMGVRPSIHQMMDVVGRFLVLVRPRGKPLPNSKLIKLEAWALRRLVSIFSQITRRPHVPRNQQLRKLFSLVGIEVPSKSNDGDGTTGDDDNDEHPESESEDAFTEDECLEEDTGAEPSPPSSATRVVSRESLVASPPITTPQPRQCRDSSPSTGPKVHDPVKCGWICRSCNLVHRHREKLAEQKCPNSPTGAHSKLEESPYMCNACFTLADTMGELKNKPCLASPPIETSSEKFGTCCGMQGQAPKRFEEIKTISDEMEAARKEIRRLQLLKLIESERQLLAKFAARKARVSLDATDTLPMEQEEFDDLAAIEAKRSDPAPPSSSETANAKSLRSATLVYGQPEPAQEEEAPNRQAYVNYWAKFKVKRETAPKPEGPKPTNEDSLPATATQTVASSSAEKCEPPSSVSNKPEKGEEESKPAEQKENTNDGETASKEDAAPNPKPAGMHEHVESYNEPCISPAQQLRNLTGKSPKKRGRPAGAKAKAKSKPASAKPKAAAKAKAKAKAKSQARKRKASKERATPASRTEEEEPNEEEPNEEDDASQDASEHDSQAASSGNADKAAATESGEASSKDEGHESGTGGKAKKLKKPSSKAEPKKTEKARKRKASRPKKEAPSSSKDSKGQKKKSSKDTSSTAKSAEHKALLSRKSCAYKKARREARAAGLSPQKVSAAAKKAYADTK